MKNEILRYDSVEICFGENVVIHDVSFALQEGEILGIVGESGSGKSTLMKAAIGILEGGTVTKGDIWYRGKNLPDLSEKEMRGICGGEIGMIFQDSGASMCPIRTIGSQICETMGSHHKMSKAEMKKKAFEVFEKIHFHDGERVWNSYPFELSGGMNQRAGIAIAMLSDPKIILADEPTSALDVTVQKQVVQELVSLRDRFGTSIVVVSHDIGVIAAMADQVLVLKDGNLVEYGPTKEILENPQQEYTKTLISAMPKLRRD